MERRTKFHLSILFTFSAKSTKGVYCHLVGLGLGVWQAHNLQGKWIVDAYAILQFLSVENIHS